MILSKILKNAFLILAACLVLSACATKKEVAVSQVDTIETVIPNMEPEVSMEDFTMIEKYQSGKDQSIAIRTYFDRDSENMGLENYGMSLFEGVIHEEELSCLEVNGIKRYVTGLNEFAPEIKKLSPREIILTQGDYCLDPQDPFRDPNMQKT